MPVHRSFQENAPLINTTEPSVTAHNLKSVSDSSSKVLVACQSTIVLHGSDVKPGETVSDSVIEMSSLSPSLGAGASGNRQRSQNTDLTSQRLAAFSHLKSEKSHFKDSNIPAMVAEGTELLEVVISGGSSDTAAGVRQEQLQQQLGIADFQHLVQQDSAAAGGDGTSIETRHGSSVRKKKQTIAPLALNQLGSGSINPLISAIRGPTRQRTKHNEGYEIERWQSSCGAALPVISASPQPQLYTPAHVKTSQINVHATNAQDFTAQPLSQSRCCPRDTVNAANDAPADTVIVPQPPPRSRSRPRILPEAVVAQASAESDVSPLAIFQQLEFGDTEMSNAPYLSQPMAQEIKKASASSAYSAGLFELEEVVMPTTHPASESFVPIQATPSSLAFPLQISRKAIGSDSVRTRDILKITGTESELHERNGSTSHQIQTKLPTTSDPLKTHKPANTLLPSIIHGSSSTSSAPVPQTSCLQQPVTKTSEQAHASILWHQRPVDLSPATSPISSAAPQVPVPLLSQFAAEARLSSRHRATANVTAQSNPVIRYNAIRGGSEDPSAKGKTRFPKHPSSNE